MSTSASAHGVPHFGLVVVDLGSGVVGNPVGDDLVLHPPLVVLVVRSGSPDKGEGEYNLYSIRERV